MIIPFYVLIYIFLFFKIGSPVIFKQLRSGKDGKTFYLYKFRTMITNLKIKEKKRFYNSLLYLRRSRLDELPQLINIIKGDICFIGPRPLLPEYNKLYSKEHRKRLTVLPGITGWAQINGDNNISWKKKFDLDIWYINNQSFVLDIKIIFLTFLFIFKKLKNNKKEKNIVKKYNGNN
jgi:sugar transferase EpsL